ncbi:unnamed protein product, partial [Mesorhabditis spiculigera]
MWGKAEAIEKSFLLNSSPEAEFMAYTVCALAGDGNCAATIQGVTLNLVATTKTVNGQQVIDECYPTVGAATKTTPAPPKSAAPTDAELQAVVTAMRNADVDRFQYSDYTLNWGKKEVGNQDVSSAPLFTWVNETLFERTVYKKLIAIYDQTLFHADTCIPESNSSLRTAILKDWLDMTANTTVFQLAANYLQKAGKCKDIDDLKTRLYTLWFGTYSRCDNGILGSSGWEHVFSGEWKGTVVDGHHNWINYYRQEKAGGINYHGHYSNCGNFTGTFQYQWQKAFKKTGGFLIGTSPSFDFSLLSICVLTHPNGNNCKFNIDGFPVGAVTYTQKCSVGTCIGTAYPVDFCSG